MEEFMSRLKVALLLAGGAVLACTPASAQSLVNVGTLACQVSPTVGFVLGSNQQAQCIFKPIRGRQQVYAGAISRVGVDVGVSQGSPVVWSVWAPPIKRIPRKALAGRYSGASSSLAVGVGLGSNVLAGGPGGVVSLQPLKLQEYVGVNVALGISGLVLQ
ncbi:hypothetical protein CH338_10575 [Rhodoplanes elegans]|uniref:DUF992 domain-containing protein n=2 Tax=Rhodoplanes elegans TaxID=29408 RepID=A0A327KJV6_9BRAD|nr:hypothetical protein CH338_10575 [Rhodoplanes elegans]